jgi:hypothetical protein
MIIQWKLSNFVCAGARFFDWPAFNFVQFYVDVFVQILSVLAPGFLTGQRLGRLYAVTVIYPCKYVCVIVICTTLVTEF